MRVRGLAYRESPRVAQARARDAQTHARRTNSRGLSAVPVRSRARMCKDDGQECGCCTNQGVWGGNSEPEGVRAAG